MGLAPRRAPPAGPAHARSHCETLRRRGRPGARASPPSVRQCRASAPVRQCCDADTTALVDLYVLTLPTTRQRRYVAARTPTVVAFGPYDRCLPNWLKSEI